MGSMWSARDTQRDIRVAIKVMASQISDSPGFVTRFEREASAAAQIGSPHVVNIFEYGVHKELPYIVMELLEGEDLHQRFKRETRLPLRSTGRILRGICEGLHGAHEYGIIHRDLKPANVFLVRDGESEIVKVLDFGIAKIAQEEGTGITATGQMIGTAHYMCPEQIQGAKHVDPRADLWAVGVIGFRAMTGQLPFNGHTVQVIRAILHDAAPAPSSIAPDLSPDVDAFFARAMARDPRDRFQTAREMSDAIAKMLKKEVLRQKDSGTDSSPTSPGPMSLDSPPPPQPAKPPASWKRRAAAAAAAPKSDRKGAAPPQQLDASPESFRRVVPVDAPLLPVLLPGRDSGVPPLAGKEPSPQPSSEPPSTSAYISTPPGKDRTWVVWALAVAMVLATLVGLVIAASRS
jgi:serine/threonine protein kinase